MVEGPLGFEQYDKYRYLQTKSLFPFCNCDYTIKELYTLTLSRKIIKIGL